MDYNDLRGNMDSLINSLITTSGSMFVSTEMDEHVPNCIRTDVIVSEDVTIEVEGIKKQPNVKIKQIKHNKDGVQINVSISRGVFSPISGEINIETN